MQPLRIAIAGTGMIGAVHADAARRSGALLVGVSASTAERAKTAAIRLGAERSFDSSEELVTADDVDVVHICTPNDLHGPLVRLALAAGKHVICEKPLSVDAADADSLAELAAASGLVNAVPFVYRYHAMAAEARHRVRSGSIGDVRLVHGHYLQDWLMRSTDDNWRVDAAAGGASRAFADIGSHWCDLVEWVTGHRITELTAVTQTVHPERARTGSVATEDVAHVAFRTDLGATGSVVISQVSAGRKNRLWFEVDGAEHSVSFDQENPETLRLGGREHTETLIRDPGALSAEAARLSPVPAGHPLGYRDCFAAFVADVYDAVRATAAGTAVITATGSVVSTAIGTATGTAVGENALSTVAVGTAPESASPGGPADAPRESASPRRPADSPRESAPSASSAHASQESASRLESALPSNSPYAARESASATPGAFAARGSAFSAESASAPSPASAVPGSAFSAESALFPTFADAARTARITDAVLRSAHSRTWIEVS